MDLIVVVFLLLLLSMGFKNDISDIENSLYWSSLSFPFYVEFLKKNSIIFLILFILISLFLIASFFNKKTLIFKNKYSYIFFFISIVFVFRALISDLNFSLKNAQSLFIYVMVYLVLSVFFINNSVGFLKNKILEVLNFFSIFYIFINFITYINGYGFVENNPRFFGVTIHPNYMGVNLAICNFIILFNFILLKNKINIIFIILGILLLVLTGSRTGLSIFMSSLLVLVMLNKGFKLKIFSFFLGIIFLIYLYIIKDSEQFDRGDGGNNTREEAWLNMWNKMIDNPLFGIGYFDGDSENSYMRIAITFGIPIALFFLYLVFILLRFYFINRKNNNYDKFALCMLFGILVGAIFEGYLLDYWSLPKIVFILILFFAVNDSSNKLIRNR